MVTFKEEGGRLVAPKKSKPTPEPRERKNTAIYITNLPLDTDEEEVQSVFSRCGVIAEEIDRGKPRIKLYTDEQGNFKGDALILYFRAESVDLAIQMLDDTDFRLGQASPAGKMRVVAADFSYKQQKEAPAKSSGKDKKKIIRKTQKLNKSVKCSFGCTGSTELATASLQIGTMTIPQLYKRPAHVGIKL